MQRVRATDGNRVLDDPSEDQLHDLLADMDLWCNFVVLDRLPTNIDSGYDYFIQVALNAEPGYGSYQVEYREGGPAHHFQATVLRQSEMGSAFDPGFEQVVRVICDWAAGHQLWRTALPWKLLDLASKRTESSKAKDNTG